MTPKPSAVQQLREFAGRLRSTNHLLGQQIMDIADSVDTLRADNERLKYQLAVVVEEANEADADGAQLRQQLAEAVADRIEFLSRFLNATPGVITEEDRQWAREQIAARNLI